jgi:NADP-dependent 3-hydroxy acid dehydrogenase YdfG
MLQSLSRVSRTASGARSARSTVLSWAVNYSRFMSSNAKVVVITGGSSGIGEELGQLYAAKGAHVVMAARRVEKLEAAVKKCKEAAKSGEVQVVAQACDVSKEADCKTLIEETINKFGKIDTLILNAGIGQSFFFESTSPEANIRQFMDINYYGCVYPTTYALPHLHKTAGRIVVVSSLGGLMPFPRQTYYNATKVRRI